jgi:hypothetical protein
MRSNGQGRCARSKRWYPVVLLLALAWISAPLAAQQNVPAGKDDLGQDLTYIREPDILFVPTPQEVVDKMLEIANVTKDDVLYDLGCGDGRIVVTAAKRYGCTCIGYDINPQRVIEAMKNVQDNNVGNLVKIEQKDVFTLDLSGASVITLYLLPSLNAKLIPQLQKMKPGSRIVSHDFDMMGVVPPDSTIDMDIHVINYWVTPLKKIDQTK